MKAEKPTKQRPVQKQKSPGYEHKMKPYSKIEKESAQLKKKLESQKAAV